MSDSMINLRYDSAIREGFKYLLTNYPEFFVMGQGLWSPWYVGNSMNELEKEFGKDRVIDTPVSENACTGVAVGAAIAGKRPMVVHPRMDFMILAVDQIVNQASKWSSMFACAVPVPVVIRGIINRGGEQGAQHSQALHAWFAHIPGLRVAMPASVADARDLLVSAVLCDDPVLYIDDRWLYDVEDDINLEPDHDAIYTGPKVIREGSDVTVAAAGHSVLLAIDAAAALKESGHSVEVVDIRVINPLEIDPVVSSVKSTGRLVVVDGGWTTCGLAGEVVCSVVERLDTSDMRNAPRRVTLQDTPAPTSGPLEERYYPTVQNVIDAVLEVI